MGVPTFSGIKESMISYALGLGGGILYSLASSIFGSGFLGGLLGAGIAGATVKGTRGEVIATVLGFQSIINAGAASASTPSRGVM